MSSPAPHEGDTTRLVRLFRAGDPAARDRLIEHAQGRLRQLAHQMLRDFPRVHRFEQTDDVLQNALLRLWRALEQVSVESAAHFRRLAASQIRRELHDLVKHYFGPQGGGAHHHTDPAGPAGGDTTGPPRERAVVDEGPSTLAEWTEFHELVAKLPEEEREVALLIWYGGLTQEEAADELQVNVRTVRRRWSRARRLLSEGLNGQAPGGGDT